MYFELPQDIKDHNNSPQKRKIEQLESMTTVGEHGCFRMIYNFCSTSGTLHETLVTNPVKKDMIWSEGS
jgi:hypothetical protein